MTEICCKVGCDQPAKFVPKVHVPLKGIHAPGDTASDDGILNIHLCGLHVKEVKASHFTNFRDVVQKIIKGGNPDWRHVYFTAVALDSEEFKAWEKT